MLKGILDPGGYHYHSDTSHNVAQILTIIVLVCTGLYVLFNIYRHPLAIYPGPNIARFTRLWHAVHLVRGTLLEELHKAHNKYGPVVRIAPDELSYICPEAWDDIYENKVRPEMTRDPRFFQEAGAQGQSLLTVTHEHHRAMRKKLAHGFSMKSLQDTEELRISHVDLLMQRLVENSQGGSVLDLVKWFTFFAYDVQSDLAFGESLGCLKTSSFHPWVQILNEFDKLDPLFRAITYFPWTRRFTQYLTPRYVVEMEEKLTATSVEKAKGRMVRPAGRSDFLEHVVQTDSMSEADVCANAVALIGAGSDTTATLISGTIYYLLQNPKILQKLTCDLRGRFKTENDLDQSSVDKNELLQACVQETLRIYPPAAVGFTRVVPSPGATIAGKFVPGGTTVGIPQNVANHSSNNFSKAGQFCPERWLKSHEFWSDKRKVFRPFACGPYRCLGESLALSNAHLVLSRLLWQFDLSLEPGSENWEQQKVHITYVKKPLRVSLHMRPDLVEQGH